MPVVVDLCGGKLSEALGQLVQPSLQLLDVPSSRGRFFHFYFAEWIKHSIAVVEDQLVGRFGPAVNDAAIYLWKCREHFVPHGGHMVRTVGIFLWRKCLSGGRTLSWTEDHCLPAALFCLAKEIL